MVSTYPSEKYEFVSWDDDIPIRMESNKSHLPNHQPDIICDGHIMMDGVCIYIYKYLGKLSYFTHLNSSAIKGDDSRILTI